MVKIPLLDDYDVKVLVIFGDNEYIPEKREYIKTIITKKIKESNFNLFLLSNKFLFSNGILKEALADVIVIKMADEYYKLNDKIIREVVSLASLDVIGYYGGDAKYLKFKDACQNEFWSRAKVIEDKVEFYKKSLRKEKIDKFIIIRKGDRNDKH